jgi:hypothetical protein
VGLLAGLLHVEARYRDALLDGLLPAQGPPSPPPSPETIDLANWFQTLANYAAEQSARSMARHQQLVDKVAAGEIQPGAVHEQGRRFLDTHAPAFLGDVMALGLDFVGRLQKSSATLADGLYDRVLGPEGNGAGRHDPPVCVDLRGAPGSVPTASLVVENRRLQPADIVCVASEFAPRTGGPRFRDRTGAIFARARRAPRRRHPAAARRDTLLAGCRLRRDSVDCGSRRTRPDRATPRPRGQRDRRATGRGRADSSRHCTCSSPIDAVELGEEPRTQETLINVIVTPIDVTLPVVSGFSRPRIRSPTTRQRRR